MHTVHQTKHKVPSIPWSILKTTSRTTSYLTRNCLRALQSHHLLQLHLLHFPPPPPLPLLPHFSPTILFHRSHLPPALPLQHRYLLFPSHSAMANASAQQLTMTLLYPLQHLKLVHMAKAELLLAPLHCRASGVRLEPLTRLCVNEDSNARLQNHSVRAGRWRSFMNSI